MPLETLFTICNTLSLVGWLLLIVAPRWQWTRRLICPVIIPFVFGLFYIVAIVSRLGQLEGGFGSLEQVGQLFENKYALLVGWVHYLAFDLFVGSWEVRDSQRLGISHWLVIPCLVLTFLFGPSGLVAYFVVRWAVAKQFVIDDDIAPVQ